MHAKQNACCNCKLIGGALHRYGFCEEEIDTDQVGWCRQAGLLVQTHSVASAKFGEFDDVFVRWLFITICRFAEVVKSRYCPPLFDVANLWRVTPNA